MKDFYKKYLVRYLKTGKRTRAEALAHWKKCHIENLKNERNDLIIFSARMIATITLAEDIANGKTKINSIAK